MGVKLPVSTLPNTTLDVNGSAALREGLALTLANGVNSDVVLSDYSLFRITGPTLGFSITGFTGGQNGRVLTLINATSQILSFTNASTSLAANQINTGGSALNLAANGVATLIYNSTLAQWVVTGGQGFTNNWALTGNSGTSATTNFIGTTDGQPLVFKTNDNEAMRLSTGGNLGIGANIFTDKLHISTGTSYSGITLKSNTATSGAYLRIDPNVNAVSNTPINSLWIDQKENADISMSTNALTRFWIKANGNVSISSKSPNNKFEVGGNASIGVNYASSVTASTNGLLVEGNTGIGTSSPLATARLHVENTGSNYAFYAPTATNLNHFAGNTALGSYSSNPNDFSLLWSGTPDIGLSYQKDFTNFTAGTLYRGISAVMRLSPSADVANSVHGITNDIQTNTASTANFSSLIRVIGADFRHKGTGALTLVKGLNAQVSNAGTGTIADA
jgi:hypothetical protein